MTDAQKSFALAALARIEKACEELDSHKPGRGRIKSAVMPLHDAMDFLEAMLMPSLQEPTNPINHETRKHDGDPCPTVILKRNQTAGNRRSNRKTAKKL